MNKKRDQKRALCFLLCLTLVFTMFPTSAFAGLVTPDDKAKMQLVYMVEDEAAGPDDCKYKEVNAYTDLKVNDTFFVGVKLVGFDKISESVEGINNIGTGLVFNDTYLTFEPNQGARDKPLKLWTDRQDYEGSFLYYGAKGYSYQQAAISEEEQIPPASTSIPNGKVIPFSMIFADSGVTETPEYKGTDAVYIAIAEFGVKQVPENGAKVFDFAANGTQTVVGFGIGGKTAGYAYKADGTALDMATIVDFDTSLLNIFPDKHKVVYNLNGGSFGEDDITTVTSAGIDEGASIGAINLPTESSIKAPEGKFFSKWVLDDGDGVYNAENDNVEVNANYVMTGDILVFAVYEDGYKLTFDTAGGTFADNSTQQAFLIAAGKAPGADNVPSADPTRENYDFHGWNTAGNGTGNAYESSVLPTTSFSATTILYAQWKAKSENQATVTFDENVDAASSNQLTKKVSPSSMTVNVNDSILYLPNAPERTNYTFTGWNTKSNGTGDSFVSGSSVPNDMTVYALWEADSSIPEPKDVTIEFIDDGDQPANPATITIKAGDCIGAGQMPNKPTAPNKIFDKWIVDDSGDGSLDVTETTEFTATTAVTKDMKVIGTWKDKITIVLDPHGGTFTEDNSSDVKEFTVDAGEYVTLPAVQFEDGSTYHLWGWNDAQNGSGSSYTSSVSAITNTTLYAIWNASTGPDDVVPEQSVKVVFHENGGDTTANPIERIVALGDSIGTVSADMPNPPTKERYEFDKWNTQANGMGNDFSFDTAVTTTLGAVKQSNGYVLDVYAQWCGTDDPVTVKFHRNDGTVRATDDIFIEKVINRNDKLSVYMPDDPGRDGFTFDTARGFMIEDADGYSTFTSSTAVDTKEPAGNVLDVYATWTSELLFEFNDTELEFNGKGLGVSVKAITVSIGGVSANVTDKYTVGTDYRIAYSTPGATLLPDDPGLTPLNAGTYDIHVFNLKTADGIADQLKMSIDQVDQLTISPKAVEFKLTSDQTQKSNGTDSKELTVEPVDSEDQAELAGKYMMMYTQVDTDDDILTAGEITPSAFSTVSPSAIGTYAAYINIADTNYVVGTVTGAAVYSSEINEVKDKILLKFALEHSVKLDDIRVVTSGAIDYSVENAFSMYDSSSMTSETAIKPGEGGEFYIRVPATASESGIKIGFIGTLPEGSVQISGGGVTVQGIDAVGPDGAQQETSIITLKPAKDGSFNVVTITVDGNDYVLHIQQLTTPRIELAFGNSPYGEIMKDSKITDKEAAKEAFNKNNNYAEDLLPTGVVYRSKGFPLGAWGGATDSAVNMDRNDTSIFVYNNKPFRDPGFNAYDSSGTKVDATNITREITVTRMNTVKGTAAIKDSEVTSDTVVITNAEDDELITTITNENGIRPDVYEMMYSFVDPVTNETCTTVRKVVILWGLGDTDFSGIVNALDTNVILSRIAGTPLTSDVSSEQVKNLYSDRIVNTDLSADGLVNALDTNLILMRIGGQTITEVYTMLSSN